MKIVRLCLTLLTSISAIVLLISTTTFQASAAETDSTDLATLILGDTTLRSPGSDFSFTGFLLLGIPTGTAAPDISRILVTANDGALLWQFGDDSRVLRTGDNYQLGIRFETTTIAPLQVLSLAALYGASLAP